MLELLEILLVAIHIAVILFNCLGWIWPKTRKAHLWCVGITAFSWFVMGIWKGWGYCFLTDWAWDVKQKLGEEDLPSSFIHYMLQKLNINVSPSTTDIVTAAVFGACVILTIYFNFFHNRDASRSRSR